MQMAHERLPEGWLEKIVRKANEVGKTGVIIRCAEMVKKTGVTLSDSLVTRELMLGLHLQAVKAGFQGESLQQALKRAEQVVLLMEEKEHCGGHLKEGHMDMRRDLTVIGVLLELAAATAVNLNAGKDVDGKVAGYVTKMLAIHKTAAAAAVAVPFELSETEPTTRQIENWLPLWNGIKLALQVDSNTGTGIIGTKGASLSQADDDSLRSMLLGLDRAVQNARKKVVAEANGKPRRCLSMYEELS